MEDIFWAYLLDPHGEGVDIFIQLVEEADALDNHVIHTVYVELDLGPGIAVSKAKLSFGCRLVSQTFDEVGKVDTYSCENRKIWTVENDSDIQTMSSQSRGMP